tara:strand:- start:13 stop:1077 length:1065 start_codon:yes stop_codon:yes gene_type:complete
MRWDSSSDSLIFTDDSKIQMGNGNDFLFYHDPNVNIIEAGTLNQDIIFKGDDGGSPVDALLLDMSASGNATFSNSINLPDNGNAYFGTGQDLQIYHDGGGSYVANNTGILRLQGKAGENSISLNPDGSVELYHNNAKKIETTSSGVDVTGTIVASTNLAADANVTAGGGLGTFTGSAIFRGTSGTTGIVFGSDLVVPTDNTGSNTNGDCDLGTASFRWKQLFAATTTIGTSDETMKQDIESLSEAELRVAVRIKGLIKKFRFKDAVSKKGNDARIHVGAIAQEVKAAFEAESLDAARYGMFCSDTWYEINGKTWYYDADGDRDVPYTAEDEGAVEKTALGLRYSELLAFVIATL